MTGRTVTVRGTEIMFLERGSAWFQRVGREPNEVEVTDSHLLAELNGLSIGASKPIMMNGTLHKVVVSEISKIRPN